jgi:hypothetical protein
MTDKEKIRAEVKRLLKNNELYLSENATDAVRYQKIGAYSVLNDLLSFIDSLEEPASDDVEEAIEKYVL